MNTTKRKNKMNKTTENFLRIKELEIKMTDNNRPVCGDFNNVIKVLKLMNIDYTIANESELDIVITATVDNNTFTFHRNLENRIVITHDINYQELILCEWFVEMNSENYINIMKMPNIIFDFISTKTKRIQKFIGIDYISGTRTTTDEPNARTDRMSIAINYEAFKSKSELESNGYEYATRKKFRSLMLGYSIVETNEIIDHMFNFLEV